ARAVEPIRELCPPLVEFLTPMPYVALQQMFDEQEHFGTYGYAKALHMPELTDDAITVMTEMAPGKTSPRTLMPVFALHGAITEVTDDATAYGGPRLPHYVVDIETAC